MKNILLIFLGLFLWFPNITHAALTTSLTNYWTMDGNSNDSVGSNNGTDTFITYSAANGIIVQGAGFNGTTSHILVGATTFGTSESIAFWMKGAPDSSGRFVIDSTGSRIYVWAPDSTHITINYGGADSGAVAVTYGSGWNYFVFTTNGTTGQWYKNGTTLGSSMAFAPTSITTTITDFGSRFNFVNVITADLDEIGFWSRALTSTEVTSLYASGSGCQYPFSTCTAATPTLTSILGLVWSMWF